MKNPPVHPTLESIPVARTADDVTYHDVTHTPGMSLLDYYAGLAMQAWITNPHRAPNAFGSGTAPATITTLAYTAYNIARAMLEEGAKPENQL